MTTDFLQQLSELSRANLVEAQPEFGGILFKIIRDGQAIEQFCEDSTSATEALILAERWRRLKAAEARLYTHGGGR
ncbi:MAG: hypothetical protein IPP13_21535 [Kouleothrix sp.]|nr:hypothetical protein [Kouleothrix sp.]